MAPTRMRTPRVERHPPQYEGHGEDEIRGAAEERADALDQPLHGGYAGLGAVIEPLQELEILQGGGGQGFGGRFPAGHSVCDTLPVKWFAREAREPRAAFAGTHALRPSAARPSSSAGTPS